MELPYLPRNKKLRPQATELRNNATREENRLWYDFLRTYPVRVRRQRIIDNYIVDFYCPAAKLAIELDGEIHEFQKAYDTNRTKHINALGIDVIRFSNARINGDFAAVCSEIDYEITKRIIFQPERNITNEIQQ